MNSNIFAAVFLATICVCGAQIQSIDLYNATNCGGTRLASFTSDGNAAVTNSSVQSIRILGM